jgi:hypothetical protein
MMSLTGHRTVAVNVQNYQTADPQRLRELVGRMSAFDAMSKKMA